MAILLAQAISAQPAEPGIHLDRIQLPPNFAIELYAEEVPNARALALGPEGTVFAGSRQAGTVHAVVDQDGDHRADAVHLLLEGLELPSGLAFRNGSLYVAEVHRILRLDGIESRLEDPPEPVVVNDTLPQIRHHGWKFVAFGPDGWLYVPVGAPCDVCESADEIYASIARMRPDGSGLEVVAHGVRNTVGFDWHPETGQLWFTENGRDWMGDDVPPDELNVLTSMGQHFGYPYCHGQDIADPTFGKERPCSDFVPPVVDLAPHTAAIGMRFYTGDHFPAEYKGQIFIAEHGSWNRSKPIGYRITRVQLEGGKAVAYEPFAEGWLSEDGRAWGRPSDVQVLPDGSMLVSDDRANAIYRITYKGNSGEAAGR